MRRRLQNFVIFPPPVAVLVGRCGGREDQDSRPRGRRSQLCGDCAAGSKTGLRLAQVWYCTESAQSLYKVA